MSLRHNPSSTQQLSNNTATAATAASAVKQQLLGNDPAAAAGLGHHHHRNKPAKRSWLSRHFFRGVTSAGSAVTTSTHSSSSSPPSSSTRGSCSKLMDFECLKSRYVPLDKSSVFFLQALVIWMALCLPGNIVTFVIYQRVALEQGNSEQQVSQANLWNIIHLLGFTTIYLFKSNMDS